MQDLMAWGFVSALALGSTQLGVPSEAFAARPMGPESPATAPKSSAEPVDSAPLLLARRPPMPQNPASPAGEPKASKDQAGAPAPASRPGGGVLFEDDFESGTLSGWSASGNDTAAVTKSEHFRGQSAVMLKLGPSDRVNYRTEIVLRQDRGNMYANKDYCIRFAFKVKDWTDYPKWVTLFQTHAIPANGDFSCQAGRNSISLISSGSRNLALAVIDKPVTKRKAGAIAEIVYSQDLAMDRWYNAQLHYRPAFDASGVIEAWIDGKKIFSQSGGNMDPNDQCGRPSEPYTHLKLGLYKDRSNNGTQTIYYDDFSIAEGVECK